MQLNKDKLITEKLITEKQKERGIKYRFHSYPFPKPLAFGRGRGSGTAAGTDRKPKGNGLSIYRDLILENIEYDTLTQNPRIDREQLDEIVDILLETVCTNRKSIRGGRGTITRQSLSRQSL